MQLILIIWRFRLIFAIGKKSLQQYKYILVHLTGEYGLHRIGFQWAHYDMDKLFGTPATTHFEWFWG